jgi:hypothetical protein
MLNCAKISLLLPFSDRKKVVLCIPNLRFAVFLVLLLFTVTAPAPAEDLNPPDFAGSLQSGAVFWEFSEDSADKLLLPSAARGAEIRLSL